MNSCLRRRNCASACSTASSGNGCGRRGPQSGPGRSGAEKPLHRRFFVIEGAGEEDAAHLPRGRRAVSPAAYRTALRSHWNDREYCRGGHHFSRPIAGLGIIVPQPVHGATPVSLEEYIQRIRQQSVGGREVHLPEVERAFSHLVLDAKMLGKLGTALNSGTSIFLYGPTGGEKPRLRLLSRTRLQSIRFGYRLR
jgi:hypothetical protein